MTAKLENQRTLGLLLGIDEEQAAQRLEACVKITASERAMPLAAELAALLERTVRVAGNGDPVALEVVIDCPSGPGVHPRFFVGGDQDHVAISAQPVDWAGSSLEELPGLIRCICACYICSVALRVALAIPDLGVNRDPFRVEFRNLGITHELLERPIHLENTVLAGAGAIGNGFLYSLKFFAVAGKLIVADPKLVKAGNLNRCLYFGDADINKSKVQVLCAKAASDFPLLTLEPFQDTSTKLVKQKGRVRRVIVATDSRRVRRTIQNDLHLEVVDASTTEAKEIVVHSHRQPTEGACLSCIYKHIEDENAREREIAGGLGIDLADLAGGLITPAVAAKIVSKHTQFKVEDLVDMAFDSLFKVLCSEQALLTPTGRQVFAPFAFVSVLAGALLALELAKSLAGVDCDTNYMALSPWQPPHHKLRRARPRDEKCEFCSVPESQEAMKAVWPELM
jgi:molybdopterin/thiamine biosynthesis adenylyltransferase